MKPIYTPHKINFGNFQSVYFSFVFLSLCLALLIFFKPLNIKAQDTKIVRTTPVVQAVENVATQAEQNLDIGDASQKSEFVQATNAGSASPSATPTPQIPDWSAEITATAKTMHGQLEEYRTAYRTFLVARDQYSKLETLKSINELIITWKKVMDKRVMVMQSYFYLLKLHLHKLEGLNSLRKQTLLNQIDLDLKVMQSHQSNLDSTNNRAVVEALALEYPELNEAWENTAYTTLAWINFTKLEQIFLQAKNLKQYADEQFLEASSSSQKKEKERAMDEVKNVLVLVENQLIEVKATLEELSTEKEIYKNSYNKLTRDLSPVYASLNKLLDYYQELAQLYFAENL